MLGYRPQGWTGVVLCLGVLSGAARATAQGPAPPVGLQTRFTTPSPYPTTITHPKDGSGRLFVTTQSGSIYIFNGNAVLPAPFLTVQTAPFGEQGLLGLAFHPSYRENGLFFVYFTALNGDSVVARYRVSTVDPNRADPSSGRILFTVAHPFPNHRGGQLAFGPDGFLYISIGDGGDRLRAPDLTTLAGKILRIDVDTPDGSLYRVPADNPFVGHPPARSEIWALGLRNPWRFSFDRSTDALFIADVGENRYEEVNVAPGGTGGQNYGWPRMEGPLCFEPSSSCNDGTLTLPNFGYGHDAAGGCSITGGFRYRGPSFSELDGIYFYADLCSGRLWGANDSTGTWASTELLRLLGRSFSTFGEDEAGDVYVGDYLSGTVFRVVSTAGPTISISDPAPVAESVGEAAFEVTLSAPSDRAVSVRYTTAGPASVLVPQQGQLDFSPGETQKLLRIQILDDSIDEPNAVFTVTLSDPVRATVADALGQITILDDDPPPTVSVSDCAVLEGDATTFCVFTVGLAIRSGFTTKVDVTTSDGTAVQGLDYSPGSQTLFFAPGQTSQTVRVLIYGDLLVESDETFFLNLSLRADSNLTLGDAQGKGVILNDDDPPPADPPTLIGPTGAVGTAIPTFTWSAVTGASRYLLTVDAPSGGGVLQSEYPAFIVCAGSTCSVVSSLALPERDYEWRVSAGNKVGWGPPSSSLAFRTDLPAHLIMTAAGTGNSGFNGDGRLAFTAALLSPGEVAVDTLNLFLSDLYRIRRVDAATQIITTIAGTGEFGCTPDGAPAATARIANVTALAADAAGNVYFAATGPSCTQVHRADQATGIITTVAGRQGPPGFGGDGGPARDATFSFGIWGLAVDRAGNVLITDTFNRRVRRVDAATGIITTIAGGGSDAGDGGPATAASLLQPKGLAVDAAGNLYIADSFANRVRRVDAVTGIISGVAGDGTAGFTGDGGPALAARLNDPRAIAVDAGGSLWIADTGNNRVRFVDLARGTIVSLAGNGLATGAVGDGGPPSNARLRAPTAVALDARGNLFIAEQLEYRIRTVDNQRPVASAGPDQDIEEREAATLDGTSSSDADLDPLDFEWRGEDGALLGTGGVVTPMLSEGAHTVTLRVRDGHGGMDADQVLVTVKAAAPPVVSITSPRDVAITAGVPVIIEWTASDNGTLAGFDVFFTADGAVFSPVPGCGGLAGSARSCTWDAPGPATRQAGLLIEARDRAGHSGTDRSNFSIVLPVGTGTGLRGEYHDNPNLKKLTLVRTDATIDFDWGSGSPAPGIGPDGFSARWTGLVEPRYSETYVFYTASDDGVRLWVDGQLIIDEWTGEGRREGSGSVTLAAGRKYDVRLDYREDNDAAFVKLLWSSENERKQVVPRTQLYPSATPADVEQAAAGRR